MAVGFKVDFLRYKVGTGDFLHSFFSTICQHLEDGKWGSRYPLIMKELYNGRLKWEDAKQVTDEISAIKDQLKDYSPDMVVWDLNDLSKKPPWGDKISPTITSLANYFVTSDGRDMFDVVLLALKDSASLKIDLEVTSL